MADLSLRCISKSYGAHDVLKEISLDIHDGEFLTLVGSSGCGKSTLLRIIAGLEQSYSGEVHIAGRSVDALRPMDRDVAMVFQSYALYPHLSVLDNLALPLRMRRLNVWQRLPFLGLLAPKRRAIQQQIRADVMGVSRTLQMEHLLNRKPGQLSGGQKQRVALGRAMVRHPEVFLMDEPLSNLDAKLRVHMRSEIAQLHRRLESTFIYVTHDQAEAMTMSDRVAVLIEGRLIQIAPPNELYQNPADLRVAEFIGSPKINVLPARAYAMSGIDLSGKYLPLMHPLPEDETVFIGVRPESLELDNRKGVGHLEGRLAHVENTGSDVFLHIALDRIQTPVVLRLSADQMNGLGIDSRVRIRLPMDNLLLFKEDGSRVAVEGIHEMAEVVGG